MIPTTASQAKPCWITALNRKYFAKKPAVGGMPMRLAMQIEMTSARPGNLAPRPEKSSISVSFSPCLLMKPIAAKRARFVRQ
ncbi:hypothetical protein D3C86_1024310 [compost metagenome]